MITKPLAAVRLPAVQAVRILLADLDHLDDLARAQRSDLTVVARRVWSR